MKKITIILFLLLTTVIVQAQWTQIGEDIDGEAANDNSGWSVSTSDDGSIVAIGAYKNGDGGFWSGHARIYQNISGTWTQIGDDIDGDASYDQFGWSVDVNSDGSVVAISAVYNDANGADSGHVKVFENIGGIWSQIGDDIEGEAANDFSGYSISLSADGSIVAIGAIWNNGGSSLAGHVRVYQNISGTWTQIGEDIDGEATNDYSGVSVDLSSDGTIVAIGALYNDDNGVDSGHVRIFQNISGTWTQIGDDIDGEAPADHFGNSLSLSADGNVVAVGASNNDGNGVDAGRVRVFENINDIWTQVGESIDGEAANDLLGSSVSLNSNGSVLAIGAATNDGNGTDSGHVRIYQNIDDIWTQVGNYINGEATNDRSGISVSLSSDGSIVAIGAVYNDGNGSDSGHVRVFGNPFLSVSENVYSNVLAYPNPTDAILFVKSDSVNKIEVSDMSGRMITNVANNNKINLSNLERGAYIVRVYSGNSISIQKIVLK